MMMRVVCRGVSLFLLVVLAACANSDSGSSASSGVTTVTINTGSLNVGAVVPIALTNIASFRVDALRNGVVVARALATLPVASMQLTVSNGVYSFRLIAFDAVGAGIYQGVSATMVLTGVDVPLVIPMTGFVLARADKTTVNTGDTVHFSANFFKMPPTSANPLVWSATGGGVTADAGAAFGSNATWIAPGKPGVYTVTAKVDVRVSPKQVYNHSGDVLINVVDVTPPTIFPSSAHLSLPEPAPGFGVSLQTPVLGAKLQAWLNGFTALDNADGFVSVTHSALPVRLAAGDSTIQFFATDSSGNRASLSATVTIYTRSSATFHVQDQNGNPIPNAVIGGLAVGSQTAVAMLDTTGAIQKTNANGDLINSGLNAAENYLIIATSPQGNYADGYWSGQQGSVANLVSTHDPAASLVFGSTTTLVMAGGGHITGQVLDANGVAIPYARVDYSTAPYNDLGSHFTTFSNAGGTFTIGAVPGNYQLFVTGTVLNVDTGLAQALTSRLSGGFYAGNGAVVSSSASQAVTIAVAQGGTQAVTMRLAAGGGMVAGRVYTPFGSQVRTTRINLRPYPVTPNPIVYEAVTDVSGLYQVNVPPGAYLIVATNKQFSPVTRVDGSVSAGLVGGFSATPQGSVVRDVNRARIYNVESGGQTVADFTLLQGGQITGKVTGGGAFVRIFAKDASTNDTQQVFADGSGNYTINMMPGTVQLVVDSYRMDQVSGQLVALTGGVTGGYVNSVGVAQSVQASAAAFVVTANGTITQNIQLNTGALFDAAAVVGSFIP